MFKFFHILEKESWVFFLFIVATINIGSYRPYALCVGLLLLLLYLINKNLILSVWLAFIMTYLMRQAKYFSQIFTVPAEYISFGLKQPEIIYFISFADGLLVLLLYLLIRKRMFTQTSGRSAPLFMFRYFLCITVLGGLSSIFSQLPDTSWFYLFQLVKYFLVTLITIELCTSTHIKKKTLEIVFIYGLFIALFVILQKIHNGPLGLAIEERYTLYAGRFADESPGLYRPGGIFWDANLTASILTMLLPLLFIFSFTKKLFHQTFVIICLCASLFALIFTASRAAWVVSIGICALTFQYVLKKTQIHTPHWIKKYWIALLVILLFIFGPMIIDRLYSISQTFQHDGGLEYRWRHIQMALSLMLSYPFGVGVNVFQYAILTRWQPSYYMFDSTPAHNLFAQIGSEIGFFALIATLGFTLTIFNTWQPRFKQKGDIMKKGLILGGLSYLSLGMVFPWLLTNPISGIFWLLLGLAYV